MLGKHEQIVRESSLHAQTIYGVSYDIIFKSGLLTRESPFKSKRLGIRNDLVKLKIERFFSRNS